MEEWLLEACLEGRGNHFSFDSLCRESFCFCLVEINPNLVSLIDKPQLFLVVVDGYEQI